MFVNMVVKYIKMLMSVIIIDNKLEIEYFFILFFFLMLLFIKWINSYCFFNKCDIVYIIISKNIFIIIVYFEKLFNNEEK